MSLSLDLSLLLKENVKTGIDQTKLESTEHSGAFESVTTQIHEGKYGFIERVKNTKIVDACEAIFKKIKDKKTLVVVGIGGSDLGGRMLQQALQADKPPMEVIFIGDTTDPEQYIQLFRKIDPKETVVNIISKSGSTTETAAGYLLLKDFFQKKVGDKWNTHFVFTTDKEKGILRKEADTHTIDTLEVPDDVGGRFSVLTAVGIFPALAMGIDVRKLLEGAQDTIANLKQSSMIENMAWQIALSQYLFQQEQQINTVVFMPYIWRLELFANWYRQLWAESLGKEGKGILPIKAIGPADQHSQVQFYQEGTWLSTFLFIGAQRYSSEIVVQNETVEDLAYLHCAQLEDIVRYECESTRISLANGGRPSAYLEIDKLDAVTVGELILLFEIAVVYLAELLEINAFDQPGVEAGKQYLYGLLGRKEFHDKVKELENKKEALVTKMIEY